MLSGCFSCTGANTGKSHAIIGVIVAVAVTTIILGIVVVIVRIIRNRSSATGPPESEDFAYDDTGYSVSDTPSVVTVNGGLDVTNADVLMNSVSKKQHRNPVLQVLADVHEYSTRFSVAGSPFSSSPHTHTMGSFGMAETTVGQATFDTGPTTSPRLVTTEHETECKTTHLDGNAGEKEIIAGNSIQEKLIVTQGHLNDSLAVDLTPVSHNEKRENTEFDEKFEGGSSVLGNEVVAEFVDTTTISGIWPGTKINSRACAGKANR